MAAQAGRQPHPQLSRAITVYRGTDTPSQADNEHLAFTLGSPPRSVPDSKGRSLPPSQVYSDSSRSFVPSPRSLPAGVPHGLASPRPPSAGPPDSPPHLPRQAGEGSSAALGPAAAPQHGPGGGEGGGGGPARANKRHRFFGLGSARVPPSPPHPPKNPQNKPQPFGLPRRAPRRRCQRPPHLASLESSAAREQVRLAPQRPPRPAPSGR